MTDGHVRARQVVMARLAMGVVPASDAEWLDGHVRHCGACDAFEGDLRAAVRALRLPEVTVEPALLQATERRLRARARELAEARGLETQLLASVLLGLLSSLATVLALVNALAVLATRLGLPAPVALAAGVAIWFLPASLAALVAMLVPRRTANATVEVEVEP